MLWIWYLFLWIALLSSFESSALFIGLSSLFLIILEICFLIFVHVVVCFSSHLSWLDLVVVSFFNNGRRVSEISARFGMNFINWWMLPMKDRSCFNVFGGSSFCSASVFVISGITPCRVIMNPSHSMVCFVSSQFCQLIASPSFSSLFSIISNPSS